MIAVSLVGTTLPPNVFRSSRHPNLLFPFIRVCLLPAGSWEGPIDQFTLGRTQLVGLQLPLPGGVCVLKALTRNPRSFVADVIVGRYWGEGRLPVAPVWGLSSEHLTGRGGRTPPVGHLSAPGKPALTLSWQSPLNEALAFKAGESTCGGQIATCPESGDLALSPGRLVVTPGFKPRVLIPRPRSFLHPPPSTLKVHALEWPETSLGSRLNSSVGPRAQPFSQRGMCDPGEAPSVTQAESANSSGP